MEDALESSAPGALPPDRYRLVLTEFLRTHSEEALYQCSLLSRELVESGLGPEDILALHVESLASAVSDLVPLEQLRATDYAHQFLLEVMIAYGVHYRQFLELRLHEAQRDAEERAQMERERALQAERIGREREEILAVIAHELRTPITAALTSIEVAERYVGQGDVDRATQLLDRARDGLNRLSRLSADLVEASRGEPPQLTMAPVDVAQIMSQALDWARPAASAKQVAVVVDPTAPPALPAVASADGLLSLFGNLISNGVRYTPSGGEVRIRYGTAEADVWVEISDTGIGINASALDRIFEKFYRAPEARTEDPRGLGLGLSLVKQMVAAHDGRIDVKSVLGSGSTFRVTFPMGEASMQEAPIQQLRTEKP